MEEYLTRVWEALIGRMHGPLTLRLILQPTVVAILAIRAAVKDARDGRPPFGWALVTDSVSRPKLLQEVWKEVGKVFVAAVIIDLIYEITVFRKIYPGQSLVVAAILALLPYPLIRGSVNRILRRRFRGKKAAILGDESPDRNAAKPHPSRKDGNRMPERAMSLDTLTRFALDRTRVASDRTTSTLISPPRPKDEEAS